MENKKKKRPDPKDKKIKDLEFQLNFFQEKKIELEKLLINVNGIVQDFETRIKFYRSSIEKGLDIKQMFLDEIPRELQLKHEIELYKRIAKDMREKGFIIGWIGSRSIKRIIRDLESQLPILQIKK